jgi:long-chain acyl-CoA synthetase
MGAQPSFAISVPATGTEVTPFSIRRHPDYPDGPMLNPPEFQTMQDIAKFYLNKFEDRPYLGIRPKMGDGYEPRYVYTSYKENRIISEKLGSVLAKLGITKGKTIGIYSENCPAWVNTIDASSLYGFVIVSLYDTLGPDSLEYLLEHSRMESLIINPKNFDKIMNILGKNQYNIRFIIIDGDVIPESAKNYSMQFYSYKQLVSQDIDILPYPKIDPEETHFISYSSGTTGNPKGVIISHRAAVSNTLGADKMIQLEKGTRHISYLPLAHVFERAAVSIVAFAGGKIGFNMGGVKNLMSDMQVLKPTHLAAVPRVIDRVYDGIQAKLKQSFFKRLVFNTSWYVKRFCLNHGLPTFVLDAICFNQINNLMGGEIKQFVVGAAKMDAKIHEFIQVATGVPLRTGFGLTEAGSGNICTPKSIRFTTYGVCGGPLVNVEVKLEPIDGYDDPLCGEINIGGSCLASGYLYEPEATKNLFTDETRKWIKTGDVGKFDKDGNLIVVDRMRSIFKLSQGEYVAAEVLTQAYEKCDLVSQIFVYGDAKRSYLVAVVVPDIGEVAKFLGKDKLSNKEFEEACKNKKLADEILQQLKDMAAKEKFFGYQRIIKVHLEKDAWTIDNECLTPTFKLKRKKLESKYKKIIDALYEQE